MDVIAQHIQELAITGNLEAIKQLIAQGVSLNYVDQYGKSLVNHIVTALTCECVPDEQLTDEQADELTHQQWIELSNQAKPFRYEVIQTLLDLGADPNLGSAEECVLVSPMLAMDNRMLEILLIAGTDPNRLCHVDEPEKSLMDWAKMDYCFETIDCPSCAPSTEGDNQTIDTWIDYVDQQAQKHAYLRPTTLQLLRRYGAKTGEELGRIPILHAPR
jgi:hypothetical protein